MVAGVKTLGKQWWHANFKMPLNRRCSHSFLRCACACVFMFMCVWVTVCFKGHERFFGFWCHCFQDFQKFLGGKDVSIILLMPRSLASMALGSANLRGETNIRWICKLGPLPLWYSPVEIPQHWEIIFRCLFLNFWIWLCLHSPEFSCPHVDDQGFTTTFSAHVSSCVPSRLEEEHSARWCVHVRMCHEKLELKI